MAEKENFYKTNFSDLIIIILILLIAMGIIFDQFGKNKQVSEAFVYYQGKLMLKINMNKNYVYNLSDAKMKIEVENRRIRVSESDCPKRMCIRKGWIQTPGDVIVCVPNKVLIEIRSESADFTMRLRIDKEKQMIIDAEKDRIRKISLLTALSCVLQISESLIPHPIPGLRLGLANMLTLVALISLDFRSAMEIAVFRTILSGLIMGTFMSPTFILSISGAVISTIVMGLLCRISGRYRLSMIGVSIIGAMVHNMVQLYLAYLILIRHPGIFVFFPWLAIGSVGTGWITGVVAAGVCEKLEEMEKQTESVPCVTKPSSDPLFNNYIEGSSVLHRISSEIKIAALFVIAIADLVFSSFRFYSGLFPFLFLMIILSQIPPLLFIRKLKKYGILILTAFLLPLFFNSGTHNVSVFGFFHYTQEGLEAGALCAFRIFFLIWASALTIMTTSPAEMSRGLGNILSPVRFLGFSEKRMAAIMTISCETIPVIWDTSRETIRAADFTKAKNFRNLIPVLCGLVATLYMNTESEKWEVNHV